MIFLDTLKGIFVKGFSNILNKISSKCIMKHLARMKSVYRRLPVENIN